MRRALAVIMAVIVSIVWLGMIVGVPALALTGQLSQLIPTSMIDDLAGQLGVDAATLVELTGIDLPAGVALGDPVELPTATPEPEEPTPAPPTETPTEEPTPTATPTATPMPEPEVEVELTVTVTDTATLTDTASLTETGEITGTPALTSTVGVTPSVELTPVSGVEPKIAIVASQANLRAGPGLDFDVVRSIDPPALIRVIGQDVSGEWFLIVDGTWVFGELLTQAPDVPVVDPAAASEEATEAAPVETDGPPIEATQTVTATTNDAANLRSGPGTTFDVVVGAPFGTVVTVVGRVEAGDWYLLADGNWIFAALLGDPITVVPVVDAEGNIIAGPNQGRNVLELLPLTESDASTSPTATPEPVEEVTGNADEETTSADTSTGDVTSEETPPVTTQPTVSEPANLRAGPGTAFDIVGSAEVGTVVTITGRNPAGDWYQLTEGAWIFAALVTNVPVDVPIVNP
jgi:uncharacterized protein YgiM (DUF1202 family)